MYAVASGDGPVVSAVSARMKRRKGEERVARTCFWLDWGRNLWYGSYIEGVWP
jgi:hypothetical protein